MTTGNEQSLGMDTTAAMTADAAGNPPATQNGKAPLIGPGMLTGFVLVALLFPLWGFANDVTNPMVKVFQDVFQITTGQASLVQFAFYMGYGVMAIPAAIFIRKFSYKSGIVLGLALYATGALIFIPASLYAEFSYFLAALWILTCGLALLETTANPYILSMGSPETATRRLNLAQAFNPIGSLCGMFAASQIVLTNLKVEEFRATARAANPEFQTMAPSEVDGIINTQLKDFIAANPDQWSLMQAADLATVRGPYLFIACVVVALLLMFLFVKLPKTIRDDTLTGSELGATFSRLLGNGRYLGGVVAQAFYVGAQIMCWTFIIHYGVIVVGLTAAEAQNYNMAAMVIFLISRFICTWLLTIFRPGKLLAIMAVGGIIATLGAIFLTGMAGLYSLIGISAFMSLMFPTIYGIALKDLGDDASLGSAGLVMAICGGAIMTQLQGMLIDSGSLFPGVTPVASSFVLPILCFIVIAAYGWIAHTKYKV